jgi:centromeric protein E
MTLRQTITERELELSRQGDLLEAARAEAAELPVLKSQLNDAKAALEKGREEHESKISDLEAELESTRADHVQTVQDKSEEIERLESKVLEYLKGREDALVDDEERFDTVAKELAAVRKEHAATVAELAKLREAHAAAVSKLESERDAAIAEQGKITSRLADLQAALDRESEASATLRAERDKMADSLEALQREHATANDSLRAERDKVSGQLENFQRAALDRESEVVSTLRGDLIKEREAKEKSMAELEKVRQRVHDAEEAKSVAIKEMGEQLAAVLTERETAQMGLTNATAAREQAEKAVKEAEGQAQIREKKLAHDLAAMAATRDTLNTESERSKAQVQLLEGQLKEKHAAHTSTIREVEALRAGADVAQSIRAELETHRGQLEQEKKERAAIAAAHADAKAAADTLAAQLADAKAATAAEAQNRADTAAKLDASAETVAKLTAELEGEQKGQVELKSKAAAQLRDADDKRKAEVASIRRELDEMKGSMLNVTSALQAERKSTSDTAKYVAEIEALKAELARARCATDEVATLRKELAAMRAAASEHKGQLDTAKKGANELKLSNDKLSAELKAATCASATVPRKSKGHTASASVPNAVPPTGAQAQCPGHEAEIDRLDKVVVLQKGIIEEQRVKIQFWADELEKQREVVRLLTESGLSPATLPGSLPSLPPLGLGLASSASSSTAPTSPSPRTGSKHARANIPNSYNRMERGLGLLGPPSPLPIPMHPGQNSNALRKARRVTIEHDMDRLAGEFDVFGSESGSESGSRGGGRAFELESRTRGNGTQEARGRERGRKKSKNQIIHHPPTPSRSPSPSPAPAPTPHARFCPCPFRHD